MTRDYLISFIAEGIAVALSLLVYRIAAQAWPTAAFAEYALSRKLLSAVLVVALLGMDLAVARSVALRGESHPRPAAHLGGAFIVVAGASLAVALILVPFREELGRLLFGESGHAPVVVGLAVAAIGGSIQGIAYGYERGRLRIARAGALLVILAVVPLAAVFAAPDPAWALGATGIGWTVIGATLIAGRGAALFERPPMRELLAYGAPRSVGLLVQMGFLAAPAVIAANRFGVVEGGNVAFALLALGVLSTLLTPIGVVLLPRSAQMLSTPQALRRHVTRLLALVVPSVTAGVLVVELTAGVVIPAYLGPSYGGAVVALRATIWAAIPWAIFVTLRGLLDAVETRPLNARNMLAATATYAVAIGIATAAGAGETAYYGAFLAAVIVLGALTGLEAARALSRQPTAT